jgi:beta-lactamase superfamily II metal-dependent hydrolase
MANLGALICGPWLPWVTVLFNHAAWALMVAMTWVSIQFAALPGAYFYVPAPSPAAIVLYYAVVVAALSGWFKTSRRKILGAAALVILGAVYAVQWQMARDQTDLTVLPLDGGHAVYVDADGRQNDWLINCGNSNAVEHTLKNYLHGQGVNSLPRLVLADGNARNCAGAPLLNGLFSLGEIWTGGVAFRSPAWRQAMAGLADPDPPNHGPATGPRHHTFTCGETQGCWQALFPPAAVQAGVSRANDAPLVLLGNFRGTRVLLLSELSRDGQSGLLAQTNDLRADIVIAGLPDKGEPLCDALIAAIQPRVIVIADSAYPATRRASRALHERLARFKIPVIYTRTAGAVKIVTNKQGWRLHTMDGQTFCGQ